MAQPKTAPISIRPGDERLARIDAYAGERALSRHLAIMVLLDDALARSALPITRPARKLPGGGYMAPVGPASRPPTGGSGVHLGPAPVAPGSRLKKR